MKEIHCWRQFTGMSLSQPHGGMWNSIAEKSFDLYLSPKNFVIDSAILRSFVTMSCNFQTMHSTKMLHY